MASSFNTSVMIRFLSKEYQNLLGYVKRRLNDLAQQDAEDIVQDVVLNLFNKADIAAPVEDLSAYVYQALRNRLIDFFRKKKDIISLEETVPHSDDLKLSHVLAADTSDKTTEVEQMLITEELYQLLDRLKEDERAVVIATEIEGKTYRHLSEKWGVPVNTLISKKSRSLEKIKKHAQFLKE